MQESIDENAERMFLAVPNNDPNYSYADDPAGMPQIFKAGDFANDIHVGALPSSLKVAFSSISIDQLWHQARVFVVKISSSTYGSDICSPPLFGKQSWCDENKVLRALLPWTWDKRYRSPSVIQYGEAGLMYLTDTGVPGIDHLGDKDLGGISVQQVIQASEDARNAKPGQKIEDILREAQNRPSGVSNSAFALKTLNFNLPVCDLDNLLAKDNQQKVCFGRKRSSDGRHWPHAGPTPETWEAVS